MGAGSPVLTSYQSVRTPRPLRRACLAAIAVLALAGCGDDEGGRAERDTAGTGKTPPTRPTATAPARPTPERVDTVTVPADDLTTPTSPEETPGGAGDEQPAASQASFTGRGGRVGPRRVQVPPFIAIRVELRSADGRAYRLRFGRRSVAVDGDRRSAASMFDGLRPGARMAGTGSARVVIEASAEPGP